MGTALTVRSRGWLTFLACSIALAGACSSSGADRLAAGGGGQIAGAAGGSAGSAAIGGGIGWPGTAGTNPDQPGLAGMVALPPETGSPAEEPKCGSVSQMADVQRGPVDIVWIIDGSGSMVDELVAVQENITRFANEIGNAGIDHHVAMLAPADVAAGTPLGGDPMHYLFVPALVDSHNALQLLLDQYSQYAPFLRANAALHFIVVSDDESHVPAATFKTEMEKLAGKSFHFHAIASEDVNGLPCVGACGLPIVCGAFAPGREYYALADATAGEKISICVSDWSKVFGALQSAVIESAPLPCDYAIPAPPPGETLDPNKVNLEFSDPNAQKTTFPRANGRDACTDKVAWYYDDPSAPKQIKMCPAACERLGAGGTVRIELGCEVVPVVLQ